jgi:hypothetical protein
MIKAFLRERGYWVEGPTSRVLTHVFLDGGRAVVPAGAPRAQLLDVYAGAVGANRPQHLVERTADATYRMFADLDIPGDLDGSSIVERALRSLPPQLRVGRVTVCMRRAVPPGHDGGGGGKSGAHIVWESVVVDDATAQALRAAWLLLVTGKAGCGVVTGKAGCGVVTGKAGCDVAGCGVDWAAVIDGAVYRRSGLRMAFSVKRGGNTAYLPACVLHHDPCGGQTVTVVRRTPGPATAAEVRRWLDRTSLAAACGLEATVRLSVPGAVPEAPRLREAPPGPSSTAGCLSPDEEAGLRCLLPAPLGAARFTRVVCLPGSAGEGFPGSVIVRTDSRWCSIAGRQHRSNRVYLLALADGRLYQRCYSGSASAAADGRPCRECSELLSTSHPLRRLLSPARPLCFRPRPTPSS